MRNKRKKKEKKESKMTTTKKIDCLVTQLEVKPQGNTQSEKHCFYISTRMIIDNDLTRERESARARQREKSDDYACVRVSF